MRHARADRRGDRRRAPRLTSRAACRSGPRRALRAPGPRLRAPGVPEQDRARDERRRRRAAAARADAGVLRLLRLALVGPRPLAARAGGAAPARGAVRRRRPRRARPEPHARERRGRGRATSRARAASSFERPYGLAWLLQLGAELREWGSPEARAWAAALEPLERAAVARLAEWLPKLTQPIRIGEHSQTAFALGLALDWARAAGDDEARRLVEARSRDFYGRDRDCPLAYEPSGEDFLSPCLGEADLMRRVLPPAEYARWLAAFLPSLPRDGRGDWLAPGVVTDPTDPKLAHLDGLNLSRAWMLEGMAAGLPKGDARVPALRRGRGRSPREGARRRDRRALRGRPLARDLRRLPRHRPRPALALHPFQGWTHGPR